MVNVCLDPAHAHTHAKRTLGLLAEGQELEEGQRWWDTFPGRRGGGAPSPGGCGGGTLGGGDASSGYEIEIT